MHRCTVKQPKDFPRKSSFSFYLSKHVREDPIHNPQLQFSKAMFSSFFWSLCCSGVLYRTTHKILLLFLPLLPAISYIVWFPFSWLKTSHFLLAPWVLSYRPNFYAGKRQNCPLEGRGWVTWNGRLGNLCMLMTLLPVMPVVPTLAIRCTPLSVVVAKL